MDKVITNCFYHLFVHPTLPYCFSMRSASILHTRSFAWRFLAISSLGLSLGGSAIAQYGVSPSQTGAFFDDLRGRAGSKNEQNATRQSGDYDFSQDGYQNDSANNSVLDDAARQISQGYNGAGNLTYSNRQSGDYTQYSSPYPSSSTYFAPAYTSDPMLGGKRNLKLGPVNLGFGLTSLWEYNDNITRSNTDPTSDLIGSAYLNISANYPLTETSSLSLSTAIGFDHYFDHPELSPYGGDFVLNVLPGTSIAIDGKIGPVYVVVYDRVSVRPAVQNDFTINPNSLFGVFQNDAGIGASWAINSKTSLSLNYTKSNATALDSNVKTQDFSNYDRDMDAVSGSLAWSPNGVFTLGLEGSYSWIKYPNKADRSLDFTTIFTNNSVTTFYGRNFKNDGETGLIGAFFTSPLGSSTSIRIAGGSQTMTFDQIEGSFLSALDSVIDETELSDYYYNVTLTNRLSARVSQALNFGHESSISTTSNFVTADYASYGVGIIGWSGSRLLVSGYLEQSVDSVGNGSEKTDQWGVDLYLTQQLTPRLRAGLGYHYGVSDSNVETVPGAQVGVRNYTQQSFNFDLSYALSEKMFVTAGYRFMTTDAEDDSFDFDQNRMVFSANYNF